MCRRVLDFLLLVLVVFSSTTYAFFPSAALSFTTARTRCCATASTSSSSTLSKHLDRQTALRSLFGGIALPALVVLSPSIGSGVPSVLAQDSSPAEEALTRVIIVKDSTEQLVRTS